MSTTIINGKSQAWVINYLSKLKSPEKSIYYQAVEVAFNNGDISDETQVARAKTILEKVNSAPEVQTPEEVEEHQLQFLNKEFAYDPKRTPLENLSLSRKYTPRDFQGARCLDLRKAVKKKNHEEVLTHCLDILPYLRRPCNIEQRWELMLDSYYKGKIVFNREEDEAIRTLEDYLSDNNFELKHNAIRRAS